MNFLIFFLLLGLATASISFTITKTSTFDFIRYRIPIRPGFYKLVHELIECPYCFSHWVAFFLTAIYRPKPFSGTALDFIIDPFVIVTISIVFVQLILISKELLGVLRKYGKEE